MHDIIFGSSKTAPQESLAHQVLVILTSSTNPLRGWKTYLPLGGYLTSQLQKMRERKHIPPMGTSAISLQGFPTNTAKQICLFFQILLQLLKPIAKMLDSTCVGGHGNHLCASRHGVLSLLFWAHEAVEGRLEPYIWRSTEVSGWGPPKDFRSQLTPKLKCTMVCSEGQTVQFLSTQTRQFTGNCSSHLGPFPFITMAFNDPICCRRMRSSPIRVAHVEAPGLPLCPTYSICDPPARTPLTHQLWLCIHFPISHPRSWSSLGQRMRSGLSISPLPEPREKPREEGRTALWRAGHVASMSESCEQTLTGSGQKSNGSSATSPQGPSCTVLVRWDFLPQSRVENGNWEE